jgi:hypothetical protein
MIGHGFLAVFIPRVRIREQPVQLHGGPGIEHNEKKWQVSFVLTLYGVGPSDEAEDQMVPPDWFHDLEIGG